jgi:hypothetical protein
VDRDRLIAMLDSCPYDPMVTVKHAVSRARVWGGILVWDKARSLRPGVYPRDRTCAPPPGHKCPGMTILSEADRVLIVFARCQPDSLGGKG